jgi:hypothetical protein
MWEILGIVAGVLVLAIVGLLWLILRGEGDWNRGQ